MTDTLELPNGDEVGPDDVFLYNDYPYRYVPRAGEGFELSPLYWGDSGMDVPLRGREALVDQWESNSRGTLSPAEWADWLEYAADDDRFGEEEVATLAEQLPTPDDWALDGHDDGGGFLDRLGF